MSQNKCSVEGCDLVATDFYQGKWYCILHYIKIWLASKLYMQEGQQPRPGPTEFKRRDDA